LSCFVAGHRPLYLFFEGKDFYSNLGPLQDHRISGDTKEKERKKGRSNTAALDPLYIAVLKRRV